MRCRLAAALLALLLATSFALGTTGPAWKDGYGALLDAAKAEQKMILIDFYTSWCQYCAQLDAESFGDPEIAAIVNEEFVAAKLDAEVQKAAAARYRPVGFPTIVFATPGGEEILRFSGYRTKEQVRTILEQVRKVGPAVIALYARLDANKKDAGALLELGEHYVELGLSGKAQGFLKRAAKYGDDATRRRALHLTAEALLYDDEFKRCCKTLDKLIAEDGDSAATPRYMLTLEEAYTAWEKPEKAAAVKVERETRFPRFDPGGADS